MVWLLHYSGAYNIVSRWLRRLSFLREKVMNSILFAIKFNLLRQKYPSNLHKLSCETSRAVSDFLSLQKSKQSSAYCNIWAVSLMSSGRSFTYKLKNNGPMTVSWGTPCFNSIHSDWTPFTDTCCNRPVQKLSTVCIVEGENSND